MSRGRPVGCEVKKSLLWEQMGLASDWRLWVPFPNSQISLRSLELEGASGTEETKEGSKKEREKEKEGKNGRLTL